MPDPTPKIPASRILVLMPNWLGDAVMATPFLRALRNLYPTAHIAALGRALIQPVLSGLPFIDAALLLDKKNARATRILLREHRFDLAILLPNSFRAALLAYRARIPNRLGYAREFRSPLLTHKLEPIRRTQIQKALDKRKAAFITAQGGGTQKIGSSYQPLPTLEYYLKIAECLGAQNLNKKMELGITPEERAEADAVLQKIENRKSKIENLILLVPGANFGSSKCWPPEHFAKLSAALLKKSRAHILIASSPQELPLVEKIMELTSHELTSHEPRVTNHEPRLIPLAKLTPPPSLGALKELTRRAALMICNDTGPRHFAAAFDIPTVTLFGPTDPLWAETFSKKERQIRLPTAQIPCSPCQLKTCPIDHRCMTQLTPDIVLNEVNALLNADS